MSTLSPTAGSRPGTPRVSGVSPAPGERPSANPSAGTQDLSASSGLPGRVEKPNRELGNNAINDFTLLRDRRDSRYDLRNRSRELAVLVPAVQAIKLRGGAWQSHRLTLCGKAMRAGETEVIFRENADMSGITNLQSCGSYACPVCGPKVANRRFEEVLKVLTTAKAQGFDVAMVTMTVRHGKRDALEALWDGVLAGWREAITATAWVGESVEAYEQARQSWLERGALHEAGLGRAPRGWKKQRGIFRARRVGERERLGVLAPIRAVELTRGKNGWHPHIHALFIFKADSPSWEDREAQARQIGDFFHARFVAGIAKHGLESWGTSGGLDVQLMEGSAESIAAYATKMALEATRADLKDGRMGGETPRQLLERAVAGDEDAVSAWLTFATVSQGRRWLVISKVLRAFAQLGEEQTDEEIADEESPGFEVAAISAVEWKARKLWLWSAVLLRTLEERGEPGFFLLLESCGIKYRDLSDPPLEE